MIVLSIDGSTSCTGLTVYEYEQETKTAKYLETISFKTSLKKTDITFSKIYRMSQGVTSILDNLLIKYSIIDVAVFENYAFSGTAVTQLAELNGVLKNYLYSKSIPIQLVAPKAVKKIATGNGNADKELVKTSMESKFNTVFKNTDESDSAAVGFTYMQYLSYPSLIPIKKPKKKPK